jgi:hypothetical protein
MYYTIRAISLHDYNNINNNDVKFIQNIINIIKHYSKL